MRNGTIFPVHNLRLRIPFAQVWGRPGPTAASPKLIFLFLLFSFDLPECIGKRTNNTSACEGQLKFSHLAELILTPSSLCVFSVRSSHPPSLLRCIPCRVRRHSIFLLALDFARATDDGLFLLDYLIEIISSHSVFQPSRCIARLKREIYNIKELVLMAIHQYQ